MEGGVENTSPQCYTSQKSPVLIGLRIKAKIHKVWTSYSQRVLIGSFEFGLEYFQTFLDKPMQRRVILEVVNIFWKFYISLEVVPIWLLQVISKWRSCRERTKVSAFPFETQHHGVTSVYIWFTPFKLGGGIHSPPGFSLPVSTNINRSAPIFCV